MAEPSPQREAAQRRLQALTAQQPGITTREAVQSVGREVRVRHEVVLEALHRLEEQGALCRHAWGRGSLLFPCREDLEEWWRQAAALREPSLRCLYLLVVEASTTPAELLRMVFRRYRWPERTTRSRLAVLVGVDLLRMERVGRRARIHAGTPHPVVEAMMRCKSDNMLAATWESTMADESYYRRPFPLRPSEPEHEELGGIPMSMKNRLVPMPPRNPLPPPGATRLR